MYYNNAGAGAYMQQMPLYGTPQNQLKGRPVSSLEEARAAQIDFDGSLFVFPDIANKRVYTKQINLDGTAAIKVYEQIETTPASPSFVTKEEFDSTIKNLEELFKGVNKNESESSRTNAIASF